jgi:elongation factor G
LQEAAAAAREKLIEAVATVDDSLMHKYIEGEKISEEEIRAALRRGTLELKIVPVGTGSAFKNKGVQTLLDAVVDYPAVAVGYSAVEGINPKSGEVEARPPEASAPVCGSGFQDHGRQAFGPTVFRAYLQRHDQGPARTLITRSKIQESVSAG